MFYRVHYDVEGKEFVRDLFTKEVADMELTFCKNQTLTDGRSYHAFKVSKVKESDHVGGKYLDSVSKRRKRTASKANDAVKKRKTPAKRSKRNPTNKA